MQNPATKVSDSPAEKTEQQLLLDAVLNNMKTVARGLTDTASQFMEVSKRYDGGGDDDRSPWEKSVEGSAGAAMPKSLLAIRIAQDLWLQCCEFTLRTGGSEGGGGKRVESIMVVDGKRINTSSPEGAAAYNEMTSMLQKLLGGDDSGPSLHPKKNPFPDEPRRDDEKKSKDDGKFEDDDWMRDDMP